MLVAYVDESYDRDRYFIGAAIATLEGWEAVSSRLAAVRQRTAREHGTDPEIEFHGHELMGGSGPWSPLRGKHREAAGVSLAVLDAARDGGVRHLFRGVDVARLHARFRYPAPPHAVVFGHVLEQIDQYTAAHGDEEQAIVVADEIATQAEHQRAFAGYQEFGTGGAGSSMLRHISSPINFACSRFSDGLQVVDLAVYVHFRRQRIHNPHPPPAGRWPGSGRRSRPRWRTSRPGCRERHDPGRTKAPRAGPSAGDVPGTGPSCIQG